MVTEDLTEIKKEINDFYDHEEREVSYVSEEEADCQIGDFIEKLFS